MRSIRLSLVVYFLGLLCVALTVASLLLHATNRLAEAEPLMRRALAIDEKTLGADHPNLAIRLNNLASLLQDTNGVFVEWRERSRLASTSRSGRVPAMSNGSPALDTPTWSNP